MPPLQSRRRRLLLAAAAASTAAAAAAAAATTTNGGNTSRSASAGPWEGWQPGAPVGTIPACGWRECFKKEHKCANCRDDANALGQPPRPLSGWIPDVRLLRRMMVLGRDAAGEPP